MQIKRIIPRVLIGGASALVTLGAVGLNGWLTQQDPAAPPDQAAMKRWLSTIEPGEQHEFLAQLAGEWTTVTRMWGMGPQPFESQGSGTVVTTHGGRFVRMDHTGTMMGTPISSTTYLGYDRYKNKFIGCSMSTMATSILAFEGLLDQTGSVLSMFGPMDEPMTNEHDKMVKYVHRFVDDRTFVLEIHDLAIVPGETKVIEMTFTRK